MRRLHRIGPRDGANRAVRWGFPRAITFEEWLGRWWLIGRADEPYGVVWVEPIHEYGEEVYAPVHLAVDPNWRGRGWPFKKALDELKATLVEELAPAVPTLVVAADGYAIAEYLPRLGFELDGSIWKQRCA